MRIAAEVGRFVPRESPVGREESQGEAAAPPLCHGDSVGYILRGQPHATKPDGCQRIRLYWAPSELHATRERLKQIGYGPSELVERDYGQTEFPSPTTTGYSYCFGVAMRA